MFGLILPGRAAQQAAQISDDRFVFQIEDAAHLNHLVTFLASKALP